MSKHPPYDLPKCLDCHRAGQKSCIPLDRAWPGVRCDRCVTNGLPCSEPVYSRSGNQHQPQLNSPPSGSLARGGVKRGSPQKPAAAVPMPFSQQVHDDDDDWRPASNANNQGMKPRGDSGFGGRLPPATAAQFQHQPHRNLSMDDISISDDSRVGIDEGRDSGNERRKHRHKKRDREHRSSMDDFRNAGHGVNVNRDSWGQNPMGSAGGGSQRGGSQRGGGGSGAGTPTRQRPGPGMGVTFDTTPTQVAPLQPHHSVRNSGGRKANVQQEITTPRDSRTSQDIVRPHHQQQQQPQQPPLESTPDKASHRISAPPPSSFKDPEDQHSGHPEQHPGDTTPTQTPPQQQQQQRPPQERQSTERRSSSKISRLLPWMKGSHSSPDNSPSKDKDSKDPKHIHHHDPNKPSRTESQSGPHNQQPAQPPISLPKLQSEESSLRSQPTNPAAQQQPQTQKPIGRRSSRSQAQDITPLQPQQTMPPNNSARQQPSQQSMSHPMVYGGAIPSGMAPIHFATVTGDVNMLYTLLQLGADISTPTAAGLTCLHLAVAHRQPSIVQALLDSGADPNRRAPDGMTPLLLAISPQGGAGVGGDMDARKTCIRILGARGADPNTREQGTGRTALHVAVEGREHGIVEALLSLRPDVDAVDPKGMSALHEAVTRGDVDMVKILAGAGGADLNALVERADDDEMF